MEEIIEKESLIKKLKSGKPLRIKFGVDPTAPELHLGNAVILWKLKEFQELGHTIIFIIGDFTAQIGDPTDKLTARKTLTEKEIKANMKTYKEQVGEILDLNKTEIIYNNRHLSKMKLAEIYRISQFLPSIKYLKEICFKKEEGQRNQFGFMNLCIPYFKLMIR